MQILPIALLLAATPLVPLGQARSLIQRGDQVPALQTLAEGNATMTRPKKRVDIQAGCDTPGTYCWFDADIDPKDDAVNSKAWCGDNNLEQ
ncbi:hypothetical protein PG994_005037 [Apiospora phragmitis]|uniref:Uncharacterized protein n=1 Tax=Apiospora phragmitis TaxID=2905665 RepID=A0ABR1VSC6_9PEZI